MTARPSCPTCGATLERRTAAVEAEHGAVRALVEAAPYLACPQDHVRRESAPGILADVISDVREVLLVAARPRLPWRPQGCGACGAPLTMPGRRTTRSVTVSSPAVAPFTVTLDLPMLRCPGCGTENLPREVWEDVEAAIGGALTGRGVPD